MIFSSLLSIRSHPVRVRGLKQGIARNQYGRILSHPVRVRGLKQFQDSTMQAVGWVAPRAGAWIETRFLTAKD